MNARIGWGAALALLLPSLASAGEFVGEFTTNSGPSWSETPPYNCITACAEIFGGAAEDYQCSTSRDEINNLAWMQGWGSNAHCEDGADGPMADDAEMCVSYDPGCFSAWNNDGWCSSTNYCFSSGGATGLSTDGACPGPVTIEITGNPGDTFVLVAGDSAGSTMVPGGACAGTELGVESDGTLTKLGPLPDMDGDGVITMTPDLPDRVCGMHLQALNMGDCSTSEVQTFGGGMPDSCRLVDGIMWCFHPSECGIACNDTCAANGMAPMADSVRWFEAQNSAEECQPIADAFGAFEPVEVGGWSYGCMTDGHATDHTGLDADVNRSTGWLCSTAESCTTSILTNMDQLGVPCGPSSRKTVCACE